MAEDKDWFRTYAVFYKDSPAKIEALEQLVVSIQNEQNLNRSDAIRAIFDAGVETMAKDPKFGSIALVSAVSEGRLFHAIVLEAQRQQERVQAYQVLGPLGILDIAEQLGIDQASTARVVEACERAVIPGRTIAPSTGYKLWLQNYLADGKSVRHEEVIQDAVEQGILPDPEQDKVEHSSALNTFRQVASTMGISGGRRGWWQLPQIVVGEEKKPF